MFRHAFFPLLAAASLAACGPGKDPAPAADVLPLQRFQPNPASPPPAVLDVESWSGGGGAALYVAAGDAGLDVHRVDGSHLQRLGRSPATRLAALEHVAVDDSQVTLLAAADAGSGAVHWFAVEARSGALQRLPNASTVVEGGIAGLCAQRDPVAGAVYLVATTADGHLERWSVTAHSERVPGKPHRVETTLERRVQVDQPLGECAADPADGGLVALGAGGALLRVTLSPDAASPAGTEPLGDAAAERLRDVAVVEQADGGTAIVALGADGVSLAVLSTSGRRLGGLSLAQSADRIAASRALVAVAMAGGKDAWLAPWPEVESRLAVLDRQP